MIVTNLISRISEKYSLPESTVRWNINYLKKSGLIDCGDYESKGVPVKLTEAGKILIKIIGGDKQ